jgi:hypothetical protein
VRDRSLAEFGWLTRCRTYIRCATLVSDIVEFVEAALKQVGLEALEFFFVFKVVPKVSVEIVILWRMGIVYLVSGVILEVTVVIFAWLAIRIRIEGRCFMVVETVSVNFLEKFMVVVSAI